jgi:hypothetical protein
MAGVGIGHDGGGGVDDDAMNAILVELKGKTEKNECREKQVGALQGRVCSLFLSSTAVF